MDRIKKIEDVILRNDMVLARLYEKGSGMIITNVLSDDKPSEFDYCVVVSKGANVSNVDIGDIIMKGIPMGGFSHRDIKYGVFTNNNINLAVKPDNFDKEYKQIKTNLQ